MSSEESGIGESQKVYLIPVFFAWILHSTPYFFITLFPTAFLRPFKNDRQVFNTVL